MTNDGITLQPDGIYVDLQKYEKTGVGENPFWDLSFQNTLRSVAPDLFPQVAVTRDQNFARYYSVRESDSADLCAISKPLGELNVPASEWARLDEALATLKKTNAAPTTANQIQVFDKPKRDTAAELYRCYVDPTDKQVKLLVLWGCERIKPRTGTPGPAILGNTAAGAGGPPAPVLPGGAGIPLPGPIPSPKPGVIPSPKRSWRPLVLSALGLAAAAAALYHFWPKPGVVPHDVPKKVFSGQIMQVTMAPPDGLIPAVVTARVSQPGTLSFHGLDQPAEVNKDYAHTFYEPGSYTIIWKAPEPKPGDKKFNDELRVVDVRRPIEGGNPVANLQLVPNPVLAGSPVTADMSASYHPAGTLSRYEIHWGDGGDWEKVPLEPSPTHRFAKAGNYEVQLRVGTDTPGVAPGSTAKTLAVYEEGAAPPPPPNKKPVPNLLVNSVDPSARRIEVSDRSIDPDGQITESSLDWGDGSAEQPFPAPFGKLSHTFAPGGDAFTLRLRCKDDRGASETADFPVSLAKAVNPKKGEVVVPPPPVEPGKLTIRRLDPEEEIKPGKLYREQFQIEPPADTSNLSLSDLRVLVGHDASDLAEVAKDAVFALEMPTGQYLVQAQAKGSDGKDYSGELPLTIPVGNWPAAGAPTATPVSPTAKPVSPTAHPVFPTAKPVSPTASPTAKPASPTAKPTASPASPTAKPVTPPKPLPPEPDVPPKGDITLSVTRSTIGKQAEADGKVEATYKVAGAYGGKPVGLREVRWKIEPVSTPKGSVDPAAATGESATLRLSAGVFRIQVEANSDRGAASTAVRETITMVVQSQLDSPK